FASSATFRFSFPLSARPPALPSFPTRRSSDLRGRNLRVRLTGRVGPVSPPARSSGSATREDRSGSRVRPMWGKASAAGCLAPPRSEEHTSELQSRSDLVCRLLLEKKKNKKHET